jgi:hypothetical protein
MKRNKITLAVLIVLFVCQFAFASAFQSAGSAGTAAVWQHATAYDALKVLAESEWNKFDYFMSVASASDAKIEAIIAECGITENYTPRTGAATLDALFPFGIEETSLVNAFKRTALQLAWYYKRNVLTAVSNAQFSVVGYEFAVKTEDNNVIFNYLDIGQDAEAIAKAVMEILPGATGYEIGRFGKITFATKGLTIKSFDQFQADLTALIYKALGL